MVESPSLEEFWTRLDVADKVQLIHQRLDSVSFGAFSNLNGIL